MIWGLLLRWLAANWPRALFGVAIAVCVVLLVRGLYGWGAKNERLACETEKRQLAAQTLEAWAERSAAGAAVEREAQAQDTARAANAHIIERGVIRYVERKRAELAALPPAEPDAPVAPADAGLCRLDADGLRLWTAANRGELPAAAGDAGAGLRAAAGAGLGLVARLADEPRAHGLAAARMSRAAFGGGALDRGSTQDEQAVSVGDPAPARWGE